MSTFDKQIVDLWEAFVIFSQDKGKTDAEVIAAEAQMDQDIEDVMVAFSHPPGKPNRRRP